MGSTIRFCRWQDKRGYSIRVLTEVWLLGSVACSFKLT